MKPIDGDKTGIGFIRQKNTPAQELATRKHGQSTQPGLRSGGQLADLLSIIRNSSDAAVQPRSRMESLKQAIREDVFVVDFDLLVENIMAYDYE